MTPAVEKPDHIRKTYQHADPSEVDHLIRIFIAPSPRIDALERGEITMLGTRTPERQTT